jgi:hypothetical protein
MSDEQYNELIIRHIINIIDLRNIQQHFRTEIFIKGAFQHKWNSSAISFTQVKMTDKNDW